MMTHVRKRKISIIDVAREAGVSPATVSRVIHEKPFVNQVVRQRVKDVLNELDYRPHFGASFLPKGRTGYIAVATPRGSHHLFTNPYVTRVLDGIGQVLDDTSQQLLLSTTPIQFSRLVNSHAADGIILLGIEMDDTYIDELERTDIPVALFGGYKSDSRFSTFTPDYAKAVELAVEHLAAFGHKKIGFICGPPNRYKWRLNQSAFGSALARLGLEEVGSIVSPDYEEETAYHMLSSLIEQGSRLPTGYVSTSDILALGLMKAAQDHGLSVPEKLSVVSYGDIPRALFSQPPLTTVGGDFVQSGAEAAQTVIDMVEGRLDTPIHKMVDVELVVRKSAAPPED